jgi:glycosyltransferase involved in cell wall biosynthesis
LSKLLFILHYPPPVHGAGIVGALIKDSQAVNSTFDIKYTNLSTATSVDDIGKHSIIKWWRYFGIIFKTFLLGLFWRPQLVYITLTSYGIGLWKDAVFVALCRFFGLKHVLHFHNKGVLKYAQSNKKAEFIYRFVFKKAKVILLSPLLYHDISAYVTKENVFFCANGIPDLNKKTPSPFRSNLTPIKLLFLSNLIKSKGVWDLLDACLYLKKKALYFKCDIVGEEGDISIKEFKKRVQYCGLQDHVNYLGKQYGESKTSIFHSADIFIHPTHEDCFPLVLLESMQFGLPIIATDEGAISEIVEYGKTGFLVPKRNVNALAEKIELLMVNKELRKSMGIASRKKYEQEYTIANFEKRFTSIINQII